MEYLLKSILISSVFYTFYKAFLQRDTFFQSNRFYFLIGIVLALLLPLVIIPVYIEVVAPETPQLSTLPLNLTTSKLTTPEIGMMTPFDWMGALYRIYIIGVFVFSIKFLIELFSLIYLIYKNPKRRKTKYIFVETTQQSSPFSFFIWIVFNSNRFSREELDHILNHEKIHVDHWHSVDMLLAQLLCIIQWFNPFVWFYKKDLQQNLEYIADTEIQDKISNVKEYQYLLLKAGVAKSPFALTNNFFTPKTFGTHLKKRIIMLQKNKTNRLNQIKYVFLLPLVILFMYSFNTEEVTIYKEKTTIPDHKIGIQQEDKVRFIYPVAKKYLTRIASGFGMRTHPITKKKKMHNGVDFSAPKGTLIFASASGVITNVSFDKNYGKSITISHRDNYVTNYYHLSKIQVEKGDQVLVGETIGNVGKTGKSVGAHLHFEILKNGKFINPLSLLKQVKQNSNFTYTISKNSTKKEIQQIGKQLENDSHGLKIKFSDIKHDNNGLLVRFNFQAKRTHKERNFSFSFNKKNESSFNRIFFSIVNDNELKIARENSHKTTYIREDDILLSSDDEDFSITQTDDGIGKNPLYIINGKRVAKNSLPEKAHKIDKITILQGEEALKKYGTAAKDGAVEITEFVRSEKGKNNAKHKKADTNKAAKESTNTITVKASSNSNDLFTEGTADVLYVLNGKIISHEKIKDLKPDNISHMSILKGKEAIEKWGKKGENGVIEITTKDNISNKKSTGFIPYKGEQYYYNADDFYDRWGTKLDLKKSKKLISKLKEIKEQSHRYPSFINEQPPASFKAVSGSVKYKNKTYYYLQEDGKFIFSDKFGNPVLNKRSKKLYNALMNEKRDGDTGYVSYKGQHFFFIKNKEGIKFYDRYGAAVIEKTAVALRNKIAI